jgi:membrane associated rhomboid family serine protease
MIIILPIGHDELSVSRLPFATFVLIAICIVAFLVGSSVLDEDLERDANALAKVRGYYLAHDYLEVSEATLAAMPALDRELYRHRQQWLEWHAESPEEAAELVATTPATHERPGVVSMLDSTGEVVQVATDESQRSTTELDEEALISIKAEFLGRVIELDPERSYEEQQVLDELSEAYELSERSSTAKRFAFVPADWSPIGLVTHIFLHGGLFHLLFNMIFLWIVAAKLEDIWGRPLFVAVFVVLGVIAALVHGATHPNSTVPMIGASGAVAGLMGAYLIRLGRNKIKFVYAYILFRPKYGSFDAPAFLMFPLWFFGELASALFFDIGAVAYWAHVGGFVAGIALALIFKLTDFERQVLGREPEIRVDPDSTPLVAFQRLPEPAPRPEQETAPAEPATSGTRRLVVRECTIAALDGAGLTCASSDGASIVLGRDDVAAVAAARIDHIGGPIAVEWFTSGTLPEEQAVLLVLLGRPSADRVGVALPGYLIDGAKLRYNKFLQAPLPTPRENFFALVEMMARLFPTARFLGDRAAIAANQLPGFADLEDFASRLRAIHD